MKGIRFWDEAGDKATAFDPAVKSRLDTVRAWRADTRDKPTYELLVDDATDVFVNGWPKPLAELRPGDRVGVHYAAGQDKSRTLRPVQVRVYRFPWVAARPRARRFACVIVSAAFIANPPWVGFSSHEH